MKGFGSNKKSKNKKIKNLKDDNLKEQIIYKAFNSHSEGNIAEATKYYQSFIKQGFKDFRVFSNYGLILINLGKLKEAELSFRKAIALKPDFGEAYLNLGNILNSLGKLKEAELSFRKAIALKPDLAEAHSNLGNLLRDLGQLKEAESYTRKAIQLNPNLAEAYSNLGNILINLGLLKEAEICLIKAIELNPNIAIAYFSLTNLQYSNDNPKWKDQLFSENILINKSKKNQVYFYFARANIFHKEQNYEESSRYLKLANNLKLDLNPSKPEMIFDKSKLLLIESNKKEINHEEHANSSESIFIVGMFRSGSTLLESVLSMRTDVYDLGEIDFLEESFIESKKSKQENNLAELYWEKLNKNTKLNITTNKNLFNYQFSGIIAKKIPNAKIIHCFRHPLDNILSIYRANFARGNEYSSSLVDTAKVYLHQEELMTKYKNKFRSKIYDLNYDLLVINPHKEIKSLISWLGWKWEDKYLSPHLNQRSISTASRVQVRSPINSKSFGGWKNYKNMLKPAIEILTQTERYKDLLS